jgi:hypothetical protein
MVVTFLLTRCSSCSNCRSPLMVRLPLRWTKLFVVHPAHYALAKIKFVPPSRGSIELHHKKKHLHTKACGCVTNIMEPCETSKSFQCISERPQSHILLFSRLMLEHVFFFFFFVQLQAMFAFIFVLAFCKFLQN